MRTLEEIRSHCDITDDGHWLFRRGRREGGRPNIYGPDYTRANGGMTTQCGLRAVWHIVNRKAVPEGWRVFGTCDELTCCNPEHIRCAPEADFGRFHRRKKTFKNVTRRILANQATSRKRARMTPELIQYIQSSPKTGRELAKELQMGASLVSKARRGDYVCFAGAGGMFSGLVSRGAA